MDNLSRRNALKVGGALGAIGAIAVAAPVRAEPWTWSPQGSVAGYGDGADPMGVWDDEADPIVANVLENYNVADVNAKLRTWTKNAQPLPDGLPPELRDFMEHARQMPSWTDQGKLATAIEFNQKRGLYLGVLYGLASGMMSTVIPKEARAVYYSKGGANMKDRITKTAKLGYDIGTANAYGPDGEMIVTCLKTRLAHAGVRHLLPRSPGWSQVAEEGIPISQNDMMVTWHSLPTTVMRHLTAWKVPIPANESASFLHSWQVAAHMLGIRDEYIPNSWDEAEAQARQTLDPILTATPEGIKLADILLDLGAQLDLTVLSRGVLSAFTRYLIGERLADSLHIGREPVWSPLLEVSWPPFVAVREGLLPVVPLAKEAYWLFDEFLRRFALLYLNELRFTISIEIPDANR
ncbi:oxygenase MpaB family protein [Nocardia arizonensis]|uniref:oxygenase MpaB family protein n=1 Tax=Nocardia arizonensis TaxID=1141647 RepID=UPI0006D0D8EC|nr:oxygenase MpaB family protein [Nocardia arizonensis]